MFLQSSRDNTLTNLGDFEAKIALLIAIIQIKNNLYNAKEYLESKYEKCLIWNEDGFYAPKTKFLSTKNKTEEKDQVGKLRTKNIGAIEN